MANKDDFDVDDINFDNIDMDGWGDSDGLDFDTKHSRSPVTKFALKAAKSGGAAVKDLNNQLRILKRALPKEYHGALEFIDKSRSAASTVYGNALDKLKPVSSDVKEFARGISPSVNKLLPSKLRKKLDDWIDSDGDYSGYSGEDREGDINNNLQEIFALNTRETLKATAEARKYRAVKEKIDHDRHVDQRTIQSDIRKGISRLAGYQDNITYKYQKKHLELEYRQLFTARDILTSIQKGNENILKALGAIGKNTGLPDAVKLQNSELFGLKTKESLIKKIQDRSFGGIGGIVDRMATNLGGMVNNAIEILGMATGQLGMASMGMSMNGGVRGSAAAGAGGAMAVKFGEMLAGKIGAKYGSNTKVAGAGAKLNKAFASGQSFMDEKARGGNFVWNLLSSLMAGPQESLSIKSRTDDLLKPTNFDGHTKATVTDVIPGYLARILQQVTGLRTGNDAPLLRYNLESGKWATDRASKSEMRSNFARNSGGKSTAMEMERAIQALDPNNKLSASARKAVSMRMLKDASAGKAFNASAYVRSSTYDPSTSRKDIADIARFMRNQYGVGRKTKLGDNVEMDNRHAEVSNITMELTKYIKPLRAELELQRVLGNQDILEEMGFISTDSYGGLSWNMDKILEFLAGNIDFEGAVNVSNEQSQRQHNAQQAEKIVEAVRSRVTRFSRKARGTAQAWAVSPNGQVMTGKYTSAKNQFKRSANSLVMRVQDSNAYNKGKAKYDSMKSRSSDSLNQLESVRNGVTRESLIADLSKVKSSIDKDLAGVSKRLENLNSIVKGDSGTNPALASVADQISHIQADVNAALTEANLSPSEKRSIMDSLKMRVSQITDAIKNSDIGKRAGQTVDRLREKGNVVQQRYASNERTVVKDDYTGVPSELTEVVREILKNTGEIRDANIVMAKLLEGGLKVNGIYAERGGLYRGLRSGIGKVLSGAGGMLGGTMRFYGKSLGGIGSLIGGTARGVLNVGGGILGKMTQGLVFKDLYLPGNPQPVITARDLRLGVLFDDTNNKPIKSLKDIKGGVYRIVNNEREYVVTAGDAKRLITIQGKNIFKSTISGLGKMYGALFSPITALARVTAWGITGTAKFIFGAKDIYVKGETFPRLLANILMNGGYYSSLTNKPIRGPKDFAGDVVDQHGNVVLSVADMQKGLVDRNGKPYLTRGEKLLGGLGTAAKWLVVKPIKAAAWLGIQSYKAMVGSLKLAGRIGLGLGRMLLGKPIRNVAKSLGYGPLIRKNPDLIINAHTNEILLMIAELLNERLGSRSGGAGDVDGDGLRDSSWAARIKGMRRKGTGKGDPGDKKLSSIDDSLKKLLKKDFGGGGGIMSMAGNMLGKAMGSKWVKMLGLGGLGATLGGLFGGGAGAATAAGGIGAAEAAAGGAGVAAAAKGGKLARGAAWLGRGLMSGGGMLGRGLMSGGGLLARGAMMAIPAIVTGLGAAATAIGAVVSAPVVLAAIGVAVVGAGAYYLYKRYAKKENVFVTLRMAQYGIDMSEKDRVEKVLQLEKFVGPKLRFKAEDAQFSADSDDAERIAAIFGINRDDKAGLENLVKWYTYRFKPTYIKHAITAYNQTGKSDPGLLDSDLDKKTKQDVLRGLRIPENGQNYQTDISPFHGRLSVDFNKTEMLYSKMDKTIEESSSSSGEKKEEPKERSWVDKLFGLNKPAESTDPNAETKVNPYEQLKMLNRAERQNVAQVKANEARLNAARDATIKSAVNGSPGRPVTGGVFVQQAPASNPGKDIGPSVLPANGAITSGFGPRKLNNPWASTNHKGVDIGAKRGAEIHAFAAGVITRCAVSETYGKVIYIKHDNGTESRYAHMEYFQTGMAVGKRVNAGDIIGYVGSTGTHDGKAHLHFEVRNAKGDPVDPRIVLKDKDSKMAFLAGKREEAIAKKEEKAQANEPAHSIDAKPSTALAKVNTAPVPKGPVKATTVAYNPSSKSRATEVVEQQRIVQTTKASAPRQVSVASDVDHQQLAVLTESLQMHRAIHARLGEIAEKLDKQSFMPTLQPSTTAAAVQGKRPLQSDNTANPVSMRRQS